MKKVKIELDFDTEPTEDDVYAYLEQLIEDGTLSYEVVPMDKQHVAR